MNAPKKGPLSEPYQPTDVTPPPKKVRPKKSAPKTPPKKGGKG